jgi:hypothetical protein
MHAERTDAINGERFLSVKSEVKKTLRRSRVALKWS